MTSVTQAALFHTPQPTPPPPPWTAALPDWLAATIPPELPRLGKTANITPCPRCGTITLHALDTGHDYLTDTRADPTLLTNDLEVQALLTGRTTHTLRTGLTTHPEIAYRDTFTIRTHPANTSRHPVIPNHICHQPLGYPIPWETIYNHKETTHECPF